MEDYLKLRKLIKTYYILLLYFKFERCCFPVISEILLMVKLSLIRIFGVYLVSVVNACQEENKYRSCNSQNTKTKQCRQFYLKYTMPHLIGNSAAHRRNSLPK